MSYALTFDARSCHVTSDARGKLNLYTQPRRALMPLVLHSVMEVFLNVFNLRNVPIAIGSH